MYFPDRVKVIRKNADPATLDPHGNRPTLATVTLRCRIDETNRLVKNQQGEEVLSTTQFSFPGQFSVAFWDELQWTDVGGTVVTRSPIAIEPIRDGIGGRRMLVVSC